LCGSAAPGSTASICSANNYYFFSVEPSSLYRPSVSANTSVIYSFKVSFFANKNLNAPVPAQLTSTRALGYNANTGRVSWEGLTSCSKYNFETQECTETAAIAASSYDVYYYPFEASIPSNDTAISVNTRVYNTDSVCGLSYLSGLAQVRSVSVKGDEFSVELPLKNENPKPQKYKYIVNVVARGLPSGVAGAASIAYQSLVINDEMVPPPKINLGGVIGGLIATLVISGAVAIAGCVIMYIYHKKTQSLM